MAIEQAIRQYLPQVIHMSLATVRDSRPWVCEVHYSYDTDLNLYFMSAQTRRHCREIADNPAVAGNIVTQHALNQKMRGVYFEGAAEMVGTVSEEHPAFQAAHGRFAIPLKTIRDYNAADSGKFYKISVTDWYLFDGYDATPPQKFHLSWPKPLAVDPSFDAALERRIDALAQAWGLTKRHMFGGLGYLAGNVACFVIRDNELLVRAGSRRLRALQQQSNVCQAKMNGESMEHWLSASGPALTNDQALASLMTVGHDYALSDSAE